MARVIIPVGQWYPPADGDRLPMIECPKCGGGLMGNSRHGITAAGEVNNSVVCVYKNCDFHDFVVLENYNLGEIKHL